MLNQVTNSSCQSRGYRNSLNYPQSPIHTESERVLSYADTAHVLQITFYSLRLLGLGHIEANENREDMNQIRQSSENGSFAKPGPTPQD